MTDRTPDHAAPPRLVLASGSPRRQGLLTEAGYCFDVCIPSASAECGVCSGETPPELVARLAYQKAADVGPRVSPALVLACDTVAECLGQILGKPADEDHARQMLRLLRGREHRVYSGLCLWRWPDGQPNSAVDQTTLCMEDLTDKQIEEYLASGQWEGKAGAFGYQDRTGWLRIVSGSESNVVGLPMELLQSMLASAQSSPPPVNP
jgi:septum formation protein